MRHNILLLLAAVRPDMLRAAGQPLMASPPSRSAALKQLVKNLLPTSAVRAVQRRRGGDFLPPIGQVQLGDLDRLTPISDHFGYDRGLPVDRHYIESWLEQRKADLRGRVLEIGDATYSERFGGKKITRQDVLHIHADNPLATLVGDMSEPGVLPSDVFDCMVLTQTLHFVFDMRAAVREAYRSLAPGGVALVTVPGISRVDRGEWADLWFWALTPTSARRLFVEEFGVENVEVETFGNVYAATTFLQGMSFEEVDPEKLKPVDVCFPVIIAIRARKPG